MKFKKDKVIMVSKRVEWVDIYKGLAIILVVIGHTTGMFNSYIYQFHVAAFFFISGYVVKWEKTSLLLDMYKKIMTLLLPLFTMVLLLAIPISLMRRLGLTETFGYDDTTTKISYMVDNFLRWGNVVNLLGASWFLLVLFFAAILSHSIYVISLKNKYLFLLITICVYVFGYYKMRQGYSLKYGADIALIAQAYYGIGFLVKSAAQPKFFKNNNVAFCTALFIMSGLAMYVMKSTLVNLCLMNIADRQMNSLIWNTIAVANGIVWLYALSVILSVIPFTKIKATVIALGKNSLGIMLLHFSFFRLTAVVLFLIGVVNAEELKLLIPSTDIGIKYGWIYVLVALVGSYVLWTIFSKIPVIKQLLGFDRSFINWIIDTKIVHRAESISESIRLFLEKKTKTKWLNPIELLLALYIFVHLFGKALVVDAYTTIVVNKGTTGTICVSFPYNGHDILFEEGWFDQSDTENYRWVKKESSFRVGLKNQKSIKLDGYIPEGIDVSKMNVYLNGKLLSSNEVCAGDSLSTEFSILDATCAGENIVTIQFDGERVSGETDPDKREFSAMFTQIVIK